MEAAFLATGSYDRTIRIWDVGSQQPLATYNFRQIPNSLSLSPDWQHLAAVGKGSVSVYDLKQNAEPCKFDSEEALNWTACRFTDDGMSLLACSDSGLLRRYCQRSAQVEGIDVEVGLNTMEVDGASGYILLGDQEGCLHAFDLRQMKTEVGKVVAFEHDIGVRYLLTLPGSLLACCDSRGILKLYKYGEGGEFFRQLQSIQAHVGMITHISATKDGTHIATSGIDRSCKIWFLRSPETTPLMRYGELPQQDMTIWSSVFVNNADGIFTTSDKTLKLWRWRHGVPREPVNIFAGHSHTVVSVLLKER